MLWNPNTGSGKGSSWLANNQLSFLRWSKKLGLVYVSLLHRFTHIRFEESHNSPTIFRGLRHNMQTSMSRILRDLGFLLPHPTRQMFHGLNSVSGSLWHFSQPQPQQQGMWRRLSTRTRPCSITSPSAGTPNPTRSLVWPKPSLCPAWKHLPDGSAGPGAQGNIPSCCWELQNSPSFHRTQDFTQIYFVILGRRGFLWEMTALKK